MKNNSNVQLRLLVTIYIAVIMCFIYFLFGMIYARVGFNLFYLAVAMLPLLAIHSFSWSISGIRITKEIAKSKYFYVPFLVVFWILINAFWIVKRLRVYLMQ